jgi:hypothetical protein
MKKITNRLAVMALGLMMALGAAACTKSSWKSYSFKVTTGDNVEVKLDTSDGFDLTQEDGRFTVKNPEGREVLQASFGTAEDFNRYVNVVKSDKSAKINSEDDKYIYWDYTEADGTVEHDRAVMVSDKTGIMIGSLADKSEGEKAYEALTFTVK